MPCVRDSLGDTISDSIIEFRDSQILHYFIFYLSHPINFRFLAISAPLRGADV